MNRRRWREVVSMSTTRLKIAAKGEKGVGGLGIKGGNPVTKEEAEAVLKVRGAI